MAHFTIAFTCSTCGDELEFEVVIDNYPTSGSYEEPPNAAEWHVDEAVMCECGKVYDRNSFHLGDKYEDQVQSLAEEPDYPEWEPDDE